MAYVGTALYDYFVCSYGLCMNGVHRYGGLLSWAVYNYGCKYRYVLCSCGLYWHGHYMATTYAVTAHLGIAYIVTAPCSYALYSYGLWPMACIGMALCS